MVQPSIRLLLLCGLIALVAFSTYSNACWFGGEAYLRFSQQRGRAPETMGTARRAAAIAYRLQPFSARALQSQADIDLFQGKTDLALNEYASALTMAPADPYLWRDNALALIYAGVLDQRVERSVIQAQAWARKSKQVHLSLAVAGLRVYKQSSPALRAMWIKSTRYAYWYQPDAILWAAYSADEELLLCDGSIILKPESNPWCASARWRNGLCSDVASCFRRQDPLP